VDPKPRINYPKTRDEAEEDLKETLMKKAVINGSVPAKDYQSKIYNKEYEVNQLKRQIQNHTEVRFN
jgi:hypothetical protein